MDIGGIKLTNMFGGNTFILGDNSFTRFVVEIETRHFTTQPLRHQRKLDTSLAQIESIEFKKLAQNLLRRQPNCFEQHGDGHFATAVNTEKQDIFRIELKIQPGTAIRNDARRKEQLARTMRFAAIMFKKGPRRTVQLRNDHALRTIDNERARRRHERNFTHVHFLLFDFFNRIRRFAIHDDQTHPGTQRRGKSQAALLTFFDIEGRLGQRITDKLKPCISAVTDDRKNRCECCLQTLIFALLRRHSGLQEVSKRLQLCR